MKKRIFTSFILICLLLTMPACAAGLTSRTMRNDCPSRILDLQMFPPMPGTPRPWNTAGKTA